VAATVPHTWACPSCGRRVPLRAEACHCGLTRARAEAVLAAQPPAEAAPRRPRMISASDRQEAIAAMTGEVKLLLAASALVLVAGLGYLVFGPKPQPMPAVLGFVDGGPPPSPRTKAPPKPPFKLPWWK
jgi:hypothetical protein